MTSETKRKTILVVSGSEENQFGRYLQKIFCHPIYRYFQWSMHQVQTCREAFQFLLKKPVPLIISWNHLPDGTWRDLLRQTAVMIRPPLLIVSYQPVGRYLWSEILNLGGYDVLVKPFGPPDVFRQITLAWEHWKERAS
jgi:hypothetical protein